VSDQIGAPTDAGLIADVTARLIEHRPQAPSGIYHLAAAGETSWHGFACHLIEEAKRLRPDLNWRVEEILAVRTEDYETPAQRPKNSRLDTAKLCTILGFELPTWQYRASAQVAEILEQISHERS
jgi:dTDP-4-dehydrorhamnose reductase